MVFPDEDLQAVSDALHAVVQEARDAGVWVFGGGIDESIPPVMVDGDGTVTEGTYTQTKQLEGGYTVLELPSREAALEWAAKIAVACRCAQEVRAFQYDPRQLTAIETRSVSRAASTSSPPRPDAIPCAARLGTGRPGMPRPSSGNRASVVHRLARRRRLNCSPPASSHAMRYRRGGQIRASTRQRQSDGRLDLQCSAHDGVAAPTYRRVVQ